MNGLSDNLERIMARAAMDEAFCSDLLERRVAAAVAAGFVLTGVEQTMLRSAPREQLLTVIATLAAAPRPEPPPTLPAPQGIRPDLPPPPAGIRPDWPSPSRGIRPDPPSSPVDRGIRPDWPSPSRGIRPDPPSSPVDTGIRPDLVQPAGIRPDPVECLGIRPDRPQIKGIRPGRIALGAALATAAVGGGLYLYSMSIATGSRPDLPPVTSPATPDSKTADGGPDGKTPTDRGPQRAK